MDKYKLTTEQLERIHAALEKGHRIELIPLKDNIKIMDIRREELKKPKNKQQWKYYWNAERGWFRSITLFIFWGAGLAIKRNQLYCKKLGCPAECVTGRRTETYTLCSLSVITRFRASILSPGYKRLVRRSKRLTISHIVDLFLHISGKVNPLNIDTERRGTADKVTEV